MAGGEEVEIIVIDDGSTDRTGEIADCYAEKYPETVRAVHQKNGGHGAGVNKGLSLAAGEYFKVVDSDDWLDEEALKKLLTEIRKRKRQRALADLIICNYLYDHLYEGKQKRMGYENVFRDGKVCTWDTIGKFHPSQYLVMHAQICRTEVLRRSGVRLPRIRTASFLYFRHFKCYRQEYCGVPGRKRKISKQEGPSEGCEARTEGL